ncbi:MAG: DMT family transporter [Pseudonocardiales bacterium]
MTTSTAAPNTADATPAAGPTGAVIAAVLVTMVAWASAFVAIRGVRDSFDPGALALGGLAVGALALGAAVLVRRAWVRPTAREWVLVLVCGVAWFGVYNVALNAAEQRLDAGTAAMLISVGPILIALLAGALLGEGFPRWLLIGTGVSFAGAVLIAAATTRSATADLVGVLLCLLAAATWALGIMAQKPALRRLPALQVTFTACTIGALACLPFAGQLMRNLDGASGGSMAGIVYLGLVPTAVAFGTWAYALTRMDAGRLGVTTYLVSPLTILIAWPVLSETPPALALVGGLLALGGVALTRRRG